MDFLVRELRKHPNGMTLGELSDIFGFTREKIRHVLSVAIADGSVRREGRTKAARYVAGEVAAQWRDARVEAIERLLRERPEGAGASELRTALNLAPASFKEAVTTALILKRIRKRGHGPATIYLPKKRETALARER